MIRLTRLPVPPTKATAHSLTYLTEGEATMTVGSESFKIFEDEGLIVPVEQVFSFDNLDINEGFLYNFHEDMIVGKFGKNKLLQGFEFLNVWGNLQISLGLEISKFIEQLLNRIYVEVCY